MKRIISIIICILMLPLCGTVFGSEVGIDQSFTLEMVGTSLFEDYGWSATGGETAVIGENPIGEGTCAVFEGFSSDTYACKAFEADGTVCMSFEILLTDTERKQIKLFGINQYNTTSKLLDINISDSKIYINGDSAGVYARPGQWLPIEIIADLNNNILNIYSNKHIFAENIPLTFYTYKSITELRISATESDSPLYFRNFKVSNANTYDLTKGDPYSNIEETEAEEGVIKIDDLGAVPNDGADDSEAFAKAFRYAELNEGTTISLSEGTYNLDKTKSPVSLVHISVSNAKSISLIGNNTTLMLGDPFGGGIKFNNCSDVKVSGITIDYKQSPWAQGYVTEVSSDDATFVYSVTEGYDIFDNPQYYPSLESGLGMVMDKSDPKSSKRNVSSVFRVTAVEKLGDLSYKMTLQSNDWITQGKLEIGDPVIINNRWGSFGAIVASSCENINIENVTCYASNNTFFVASYFSGEAVLNNNTVTYKPDSDRWITTNADGVYINGLRARVVLKNCLFEGLSDDCVNLHNSPLGISEQISDVKLALTSSVNIVPRIGETIDILDQKSGYIKATAKITEVEYPYSSAQNKAVITLDTPVKNIVTGTGANQSDGVYIREMGFGGSVIENNIFRNCYRFGLLIRTRDSQVVGNRFEHLKGNAIMLMNEPKWPEGPGNTNLTIKNNYFYDNAYTDAYRSNNEGGAISLKPQKYYEDLADGQNIMNNIVIEENIIYSPSRHAIYIGSSSNITIKDNIIKAQDGVELQKGNNSAIAVENSLDVTISGGSITCTDENLSAAISADYLSDVTVEDSVETNLAPNVPVSALRQNDDFSEDDTAYYRMDFDEYSVGGLAKADVEKMGFTVTDDNLEYNEDNFNFSIVETDGRKCLKIENNANGVMRIAYPLSYAIGGKVRANFDYKISVPDGNNSEYIRFLAYGTSVDSSSQVQATVAGTRKNTGTGSGHFWYGDGINERNIGGNFDGWHDMSLIVNTYDESTAKGNWSFSVDGVYIPQFVGGTKYTSGLTNQVKDINEIRIILRSGYAIYLDLIEVMPYGYSYDFEDGAVGMDLTAQPYYFNLNGSDLSGIAKIVTDPLDKTNKCLQLTHMGDIDDEASVNVRIPLGDINLTDETTKLYGKGIEGRMAVEFRVHKTGEMSGAQSIELLHREDGESSATVTSFELTEFCEDGDSWNCVKFIINTDSNKVEECWVNNVLEVADKTIDAASVDEIMIRYYGNNGSIYFDDLKVFSLEGFYHKASSFVNNGTKISGVVNVSKYNPIKGHLIAALYSESERLTETKILELDGLVDCIAKEYPIEFDSADGTKIKLMLWDGTEMLKPIRSVVDADISLEI